MMFRTKKRTLERQVPFIEKYAVELQAVNHLITLVATGLICFALGFIFGGAV